MFYFFYFKRSELSSSSISTDIDIDIGSFEMNVGKMVVVGSSGMTQGISNSSKQVSIVFSLDNKYNEKFTISDLSGNIV